MSARALDYAFRAACAESRKLCELRSLPMEEFEARLQKQGKRRVPVLYTLGTTWAGYIQLNSSDWGAVGELGRVDAIMQRDKEIFTLKRQHELSMLRVEQHQGRILKDQEDRGIYYEQNCNVHTFDTISVGLYSQRNTMYHTLMVQRLRELKILLTLGVTGIFWAYLYWRYMLSDEMMYIAEPVVFFGSKAQVINEAKQKREEDEQRKRFMSEVMKT